MPDGDHLDVGPHPALATADVRTPLIGVVVTTRNEERHMARCLEHLFGSEYPRLRVVVVDNNSTDATVAIASGFPCDVVTWGPERSAQRNHGFGLLRGCEILGFLDADMYIGARVLTLVAESLSPSVGAVYVEEVILGSSAFTRVRNHERSFYFGTCIEAVRFVTCDTLGLVGGFDESLTGPEDWDFDRRVREVTGTRVIGRSWPSQGTVADRLRSDVIEHDERGLTLWRYALKKRYYSAAFDTYTAKWGAGDVTVRRQLGWRYRLIGVFVEDGKWRMLARHPFRSLGMLGTRLLVAAVMILRPRHSTPQSPRH